MTETTPPRARIRITRIVRLGLEYITREGYNFQWAADGEMVNVTEFNQDGSVVWTRGFRRLVDIEWVLLDHTQGHPVHAHLDPPLPNRGAE